MKLHEFQAKELLARFGVPVPGGKHATTVEEAKRVAPDVAKDLWVVKSQIHAGGRGKGCLFDPKTYDPSWIEIDPEGRPQFKEGAPPEVTGSLVLKGGVKLAKSLEEVEEYASKMLGNLLVTRQTGVQGKLVNNLLIADGVNIGKDPTNPDRDWEIYLACLLDRAKGQLVFMASAEGGVEIEEVAKENPDAIKKEWFLPAQGLFPYQANNLAFGILPDGTDKKIVRGMAKTIMALAKCYVGTDADMVEVNPCVVTDQGEVLALDAKIGLDDNGIDRHADIKEMRDTTEEEPAETLAKDTDLAYIKLDGDIGCLVNGAGLAMATMDVIKLHGGDKHEPANFLDVGGGANKEQVKTAFSIILKDPNVKAILVNIFGGIMRCDTIAEGVVAAAKELNMTVPLVVRLEGNMKEEGKQILAESGLKLDPADSMTDAAQKVVAAVEA